MCKFCDNLEDGTNIDMQDIETGALGTLYASVDLFKLGKNTHQFKQIKNENLYSLTFALCTDNSPRAIYQFGLDIAYCPFCGQKLESE